MRGRGEPGRSKEVAIHTPTPCTAWASKRRHPASVVPGCCSAPSTDHSSTRQSPVRGRDETHPAPAQPGEPRNAG